MKPISTAPIAGALLLIGTAQAGDQMQARPAIHLHRWQEDWSVLADPALRTAPLDSLKYLPLSADDPQSYLSFGLNLRERYETISGPLFDSIGQRGDAYGLDRLQLHADWHPDRHWQLFTQLEDVRAIDKRTIRPVDENPLDLRQAFAAYVAQLGAGTLKLRLGRQEIGFDLQRFVGVRDGPNVRQAFDAAWANYELGDWRFIGFVSQPVNYHHERWLDDDSSGRLRYGGLRVERAHVGPGELSAYYSQYRQASAQYANAAGSERRDIVDLRYAGNESGADWDLEAMNQSGHVGAAGVSAWALGARAGYTWTGVGWTPRLGLQFDAASGDRDAHDGRVETFNPLFPNGYYFTLAGFTGYTNLIHLKPSLTIKPLATLTVLGAAGLQWRQSTGDAVYTQPDIAVPGTAGAPGRWSGAYGQLRADWAITPLCAAAVEAVHYAVGDAIRRAGGHDANYLGVEFKFAW